MGSQRVGTTERLTVLLLMISCMFWRNSKQKVVSVLLHAKKEFMLFLFFFYININAIV